MNLPAPYLMGLHSKKSRQVTDGPSLSPSRCLTTSHKSAQLQWMDSPPREPSMGHTIAMENRKVHP